MPREGKQSQILHWLEERSLWEWFESVWKVISKWRKICHSK
jgi:hypothetical protein